MATSQVHKSWIDPTLIATNINGLSKPKRWIKMNGASHGCPWCRKVPTCFPHGAFDDFPIEIPNWAIPSAVLVWDKHSRAKYLSVAPFGCPRPGLESDNFGAEKNHYVKRMDRAKKTWTPSITFYNHLSYRDIVDNVLRYVWIKKHVCTRSKNWF